MDLGCRREPSFFGCPSGAATRAPLGASELQWGRDGVCGRTLGLQATAGGGAAGRVPGEEGSWRRGQAPLSTSCERAETGRCALLLATGEGRLLDAFCLGEEGAEEGGGALGGWRRDLVSFTVSVRVRLNFRVRGMIREEGAEGGGGALEGVDGCGGGGCEWPEQLV